MSNQQNFQNQQAGRVTANSCNPSFHQPGIETQPGIEAQSGTATENRHHKMQPPGVNPDAAPYGGAHPFGVGTYGVPGMYPYAHHLHGYGAFPYGYGHYYHPYGYHHHFGWHHPGYGPFYPHGAVGYGHYPYGPRDFANNNYYQQPFSNEPAQEWSFTQNSDGFQYTNQVNPGVPYAPYGQPQFAANPYQGFNRPQQQPGQVIQGTSTPVRKERKGAESNSFRGTDESTPQQSQ